MNSVTTNAPAMSPSIDLQNLKTKWRRTVCHTEDGKVVWRYFSLIISLFCGLKSLKVIVFFALLDLGNRASVERQMDQNWRQ